MTRRRFRRPALAGAVLAAAAAAALLASAPGGRPSWLRERLWPGRDRPEVVRGIPYLPGGDPSHTVDLYLPAGGARPMPAVLYFHGGGWVGGSKRMALPATEPFLERGFAVASAAYRLAGRAPAPAAVEDARCALRWLRRHGPGFGLDTARIVLAGSSAGGHIALAIALLPDTAPPMRRCAEPGRRRAAAVVSFAGVTDVAELLAGPEPRPWAAAWIGDRPDRMALARALSPIAHVRPGAPPVLSVHGDADDVVPYGQAVRLHRALDAAGVPNRLVAVRGGPHDRLTPGQRKAVGRILERFLAADAGLAAPRR